MCRYGLAYLYMRPGPRAMLQRYLELYRLQVPCSPSMEETNMEWLHSEGHALRMQADGQAFRTPEELLSAVDLYNLTQRSFRDEMEVRQHWLQLQV